MEQMLRPLSPRPALLVDEHGRKLADPTDSSRVGQTGPFGRERCLYALPIGGVGAQQYAPVVLLRDHDSADVADPQGVVVGVDSLWISRLLFARWTEDTRRLAG